MPSKYQDFIHFKTRVFAYNQVHYKFNAIVPNEKIAYILFVFFIFGYQNYCINAKLRKESKIKQENEEYVMLFKTISKHFPSSVVSFHITDSKDQTILEL